MRRRAADFRRPVKRRVPDVVWWALCSVVVLLFIYILSKGSQIESRSALSKVKYMFLFVFCLSVKMQLAAGKFCQFVFVGLIIVATSEYNLCMREINAFVMRVRDLEIMAVDGMGLTSFCFPFLHYVQWLTHCDYERICLVAVFFLSLFLPLFCLRGTSWTQYSWTTILGYFYSLLHLLKPQCLNIWKLEYQCYVGWDA